jgi:hypothetical protein
MGRVFDAGWLATFASNRARILRISPAGKIITVQAHQYSARRRKSVETCRCGEILVVWAGPRRKIEIDRNTGLLPATVPAKLAPLCPSIRVASGSQSWCWRNVEVWANSRVNLYLKSTVVLYGESITLQYPYCLLRRLPYSGQSPDLRCSRPAYRRTSGRACS